MRPTRFFLLFNCQTPGRKDSNCRNRNCLCAVQFYRRICNRKKRTKAKIPVGASSGALLFSPAYRSFLAGGTPVGYGNQACSYHAVFMYCGGNSGRDAVLKKTLKNTYCYGIMHNRQIIQGGTIMEHIKTLNTKNLQNTIKKGGCGECQTSCQSACKTSCTVGNQSCENK